MHMRNIIQLKKFKIDDHSLDGIMCVKNGSHINSSKRSHLTEGKFTQLIYNIPLLWLTNDLCIGYRPHKPEAAIEESLLQLGNKCCCKRRLWFYNSEAETIVMISQLSVLNIYIYFVLCQCAKKYIVLAIFQLLCIQLLNYFSIDQNFAIFWPFVVVPTIVICNFFNQCC